MSVYICEEHQSKTDLACPVCWQKKCIEARDEQIKELTFRLAEKEKEISALETVLKHKVKCAHEAGQKD